MRQYHNLMKEVLEKGIQKSDRTGTGTISIFGHQMRFDLSQGFPMVSTKKLHTRSIIVELLWFLNGDTNIKFLNENGCSIWDFAGSTRHLQGRCRRLCHRYRSRPPPCGGTKHHQPACGLQCSLPSRSWHTQRAQRKGFPATVINLSPALIPTSSEGPFLITFKTQMVSSMILNCTPIPLKFPCICSCSDFISSVDR